MNAVGFAWRSLVRQPARAALGVLGVAAVGALLFDMLMLSNGLVLSMRNPEVAALLSLDAGIVSPHRSGLPGATFVNAVIVPDGWTAYTP